MQVPKVEKPKVPIKPAQASAAEKERTRPKGRESLISAGRLVKKATTLKSTLLG